MVYFLGLIYNNRRCWGGVPLRRWVVTWVLGLILSATVGLANDGVCELELRALGAAYERFRNAEARAEDLIQAAQRVRVCPGISDADRERALASEIWAQLGSANLDEADALLDHFFVEFGETATADRKVWAYRTRARIRSFQGHPMEAVQWVLRGSDYVEELLPHRQVDLITALAQNFYEVGALSDAIATIRRAITMVSVGGDEYVDAFLKASLANYEKAEWMRGARRDSSRLLAATEEIAASVGRMEMLLEDARASRRQRLLQLFEAQRNLAHAYILLNDGISAIEVAERAMDSAEQSGNANDRVPSLITYGSALRAGGRYHHSLRVLEEARALAGSNSGTVAVIEMQIGLAHKAAGKVAEAETALREAIRLQEQQSLEMGASEWSSLSLDYWQAAYRALVSLLLSEGRSEEAFVFLEQSRARWVRGVRRLSDMQTLSEDARERVQDLQAELREARALLRDQADQDPALTLRITRLESALSRVGVTESVSPPLTVRDLQSRLSDERTVISYFLDTPATAFVVRRGTFAAVPLEVDKLTLWHHVESFPFVREQAYSRVSVGAQPLQQLYHLVFRPVVPLIPSGAPITVIADDALLQVPFGMLVDGPAAPHRFHEWPFLIHRHAFTTELAAVLIGQNERADGPRSLVGFGKSDFEHGDAWRSGDEAVVLRDLPHIDLEMASVQRHFPSGSYFRDDAATPERLFSAMTEARVLHLASHVLAAPERPLYSSIVLSPDSKSPSGSVYLYDLQGRGLRAALVVLSACDSAQGELRRGEGIVGLHAAFRAAGADASLATLWPVDDESTAFLMERFYGYLKSGLPKDKALQRAQIDILQSRTTLAASPFFWAGFVLSGDPGPVELGSDGRHSSLWFVGGLLLLVGAWLTTRKPLLTMLRPHG